MSDTSPHDLFHALSSEPFGEDEWLKVSFAAPVADWLGIRLFVES
jgi:hypothetical protein